MPAPMPACLVYSTFPSLEAAEAAARELVDRRLAACANILPGMISVYRWAGVTERGAETVVILKTTLARADELTAAVRALHPYELPAILVLPVSGGDAGYLAWIAAETAPPAEG